MGAVPEIIDKPLTQQALGERYRDLCADPRFANLPRKIELDTWGRILMRPASNYHGMLQARLAQRLAVLGGQAFSEASVLTLIGLLAADLAWASVEFVRTPGASEAWIVYPQSKRFEFFGGGGSLQQSAFTVDLAQLFD